MTHEYLPPTYALVRPKPVPDPEAELERLEAALSAARAWLYAGQVSAS